MIPFFAVYSTFLQRGYDQIIHDVALQNLHCVFAIDRAGIVGRDGETHQGIFDLSYLSHVPNITIMAPSCGMELKKMMRFAVNECNGPVAIRYPRGDSSGNAVESDILCGKGVVIKDGDDVELIALGSSVKDAMEASTILEKNNVSCAVIDARFLKPLDEELIKAYAEKCKLIGTVEENVAVGGLYTAVNDLINKEIVCFALPCEPIKQGEIGQIKEKYKIDGKGIADKILKNLSK